MCNKLLQGVLVFSVEPVLYHFYVLITCTYHKLQQVYHFCSVLFYWQHHLQCSSWIFKTKSVLNAFQFCLHFTKYHASSVHIWKWEIIHSKTNLTYTKSFLPFCIHDMLFVDARYLKHKLGISLTNEHHWRLLENCPIYPITKVWPIYVNRFTSMLH